MATTLSVGRQERFAQWWSLRSGRERLALVLVSSVAAFALLWWLAWQPLQRDSERLARALVEQRATLVEARRQADEIAGLARNAPTPPAGDARAAIESALARQGLKPSGAIERIEGDRWRMSFDAIAFDALASLLDMLQRDAGVRAADVSVTGRVEPGQVRAEVTLTRG
jgi:type II secretory pathway component PulM